MAQTIETWRDLLESKKAFAHIATLMPDGSPQSTPVWIDYRDGKVLVNSAKGRVKVNNLKPGSPVAISITDPDNPYRYVQIRGKVARVTEEGASEHIDKMAKKYLGKDKYPFAQPGEVRVLFEIEPSAVSGNK
jgi:PPOX class probable F420-dependent enzyme